MVGYLFPDMGLEGTVHSLSLLSAGSFTSTAWSRVLLLMMCILPGLLLAWEGVTNSTV